MGIGVRISVTAAFVVGIKVIFRFIYTFMNQLDLGTFGDAVCVEGFFGSLSPKL